MYDIRHTRRMVRSGRSLAWLLCVYFRADSKEVEIMGDPQHDFPRVLIFDLTGQLAHNLGAGSPMFGVIHQLRGHRRATSEPKQANTTASGQYLSRSAVCTKFEPSIDEIQRRHRSSVSRRRRLDARCGIFTAPGAFSFPLRRIRRRPLYWGEHRRAARLLSRETWSI